METPRKVFLSYRSVDRDRVRVVAEALRAHGIEAWWDVWEIRAGDNFVSKINDGLDQCECGVVFLSGSSLGGAWHQDEITVLKTFAVDEKRPLIPVLLDRGVKVPPILRPYSRLYADQVSELADAILNRGVIKPPLGEEPHTPTRVRFSIELRDLPDAAIEVSAKVDGKPIVEPQRVLPGSAFAFSYADFLEAQPLAARQARVQAMADLRERDLLKLGSAVGAVVFAGDVDRELAARLDSMSAGNFQELELVFEAAGARLLSIPFEAARLRDGRIPALTAGVFTWRRPAREQKTVARDPAPGPLKILVAVGAPYEDKTESTVLDMELELQTILDAVQEPVELGNAYVRILEVGSADQIGAALRELSYHVLHLSGHGNKGVLELEDEDGNPVRTSAAQLAEKIHDSGHSAPLILLASCHGGRGDHETASFAQGLLDSGVPAVLAMQTAVSDFYCTELAGKFYKGLTLGDRPLASRALANARRELERDRKNASQPQLEAAGIPEYATPSLLLRGEERAVLNRGAELAPVPATRLPASGTVPMLGMGDMVGRRRELRQIIGVLSDDAKTVTKTGRKAGCQILGTGGVGKSSLAGRVMQRMADRGWQVATVGSFWNVAKTATAIGVALGEHPRKEVASLGAKLSDPNLPDELRLAYLQTVLGNQRVLLVLDNFEDALTPGGAEFRDAVTAQTFTYLLESAQKAKVLITCRYPVPRAESKLLRVNLGPLSRAETRKLMLRHPGLRVQPGANVKLIERAIGGHPRTLEYLDALLRNGTARLDTVQARLREFAAKEGISLTGGAAFQERVQDAIRVAAADAMVAELVRLVGQSPADLELLWRSSVFPFAVPVEALGFNAALPKEPVDTATLAGGVRRLAASSLLCLLEEDSVFVHRWTAESLRPLVPAAIYQECCLRAAEYLKLRPVADLRQWVADLSESVRLFLAAQAFDEAARAGWALIDRLEPLGQTTLWTELAREMSAGLPEGHDDKSRFVKQEADGLQALGFGNEALAGHRMALQLDEQKVTQEPGRADYLRDLSVSYERMGDLLRALGDGEGARRFFEQALEIRQRLVTKEPGRADYLRDLSVSYERMGDLLGALGDGEGARRFFEQALEIRQRLVTKEPGRADYLRDLSVSYNKMGDLLSALGDGEGARRFFEQALEIRQRLVTKEPGRADYLRDLSVSYNKMGDLLSALGDGEGARRFFEQDLEIAQRLVGQEPGRADYLRDLSVSYERMGDLLSALGDGEGARRFFEQALEIRQRLVAQEPGRADYLRDLSVSYNKMGDLLSALGDGEGARRFFEQDLEIAQQLVTQEPGRADYLRDLSVSYNKMGDLLGALGDGEGARRFFEQALEIAQRLVGQEPGRADYLRDLSVSYERMGDLLSALGDGEGARRFFEQALEIRQRLVAQEPGRADYLRDLSVSYNKMGDLLSALGDGEGARRFFEQALEIRQRLVTKEPGRADYLRDLSVSYNKMGDLLSALGDGEGARRFFEQALEIRQRLVTKEPGRADYLRDLSVSYNKMGDLLRALGDGEGARRFFEQALEIAQRLVTKEPGRADYLRDLSVSYNKMGDLLSALGDGEGARRFFEQALEIAQRLVGQEPGRADYLRDLSVSYERMGDLLSALGDGEGARRFFEQALEIRQRLVAQEPGRADYLRDLSVSYERMGDLLSALGDGEGARRFFEQDLEIAQQLVTQEPGRADYLRDLSVSYNKMGDLLGALGDGEGARRFFEQALEIRQRLVAQEPGRADYLRDLSVSYNKMGDLLRALGDGEEARRFFEQALEIAQQLVTQEPGRADYTLDLAHSLARMGEVGRLEKALQILLKLRGEKRLNRADEPLMAWVEAQLRKGKSE